MMQAEKNSTVQIEEVRKHLADAAMWISELHRAVDGCKAIREIIKKGPSSVHIDSALHCSEFHLDDALNSLDCTLEAACEALGLDYSKSDGGEPVLKVAHL